MSNYFIDSGNTSEKLNLGFDGTRFIWNDPPPPPEVDWDELEALAEDLKE